MDFRRDPLDLLVRITAACAPMGEMRLAHKRIVTLHTPELIEELLVSHARGVVKTPALRKITRELLGNGLITSEGPFWKRQRKLMAPLFQHHHIEHYAEAMVRCAEDEARRMVSAGTAAVSVLDHVTRITMRVVGQTLLGVDTMDEDQDISANLNLAQQWILEQVTQFPTPVAVPTPSNLRFKRSRAVLRQRMGSLVEERRKNPQPDRRDLLSLLLGARDEDGSAMSDEQVVDEALTLFVAGHDTSANALGFTLGLLMENPLVYSELLKEVDALTAGPLGKSDLSRLPFTQNVIKEALRLFPPAYVFGRQADGPMTVGGLPFPKGTIFMVSPYALHRDATYWPEPAAFRPDRFSDAGSAGRARYAYIPFGGGPRICIGNHFATLEMALVLATLHRHVRFERAEGSSNQPEALTFLKPRDVRATVHARH